MIAMRVKLSPHARQRMRQRGISEDDVRMTLECPDQTMPAGKPGRTKYERKLDKMVCVVTVDNTDPAVVVTAFSR